MNQELDDDDVFYGTGKSKQKKEQTQQSRPGVYGSSYGNAQAAEAKPSGYSSSPTEHSPSQDKDIEAEITQTRREKQHAAEIHDITILRQKAAKHSAESAKLFKKYRAEEAAMVKYTEAANKARRKAEGYEEKSKNATAKADEKQADIQYLEGAKGERARVKVAKLHAKSAKLKSKASAQMAKAAKMSNKAAAKREKAKAYHEQSKIHEAEAHGINKRADKLQKATG